MFTSDFDFTLLESGNTVLKLITFISEEFKKKKQKERNQKKNEKQNTEKKSRQFREEDSVDFPSIMSVNYFHDFQTKHKNNLIQTRKIF